MKLKKEYAKFASEKALELLNIDSPSGYTKEATAWIKKEFEKLGFKVNYTNKGNVLVDLGGPAPKTNAGFGKGAVLLAAHADTLGAMVAKIKSDGRIKMTNIGGFSPDNGETENVRIRTRNGKVYEGTIQIINPSKHTHKDASKVERTYDSTEVVIDEDVNSVEDVKALGIDIGDFICAEPRARITSSGYIKSRFLDDKLSVAIILGFAKYLSDNKIKLKRKVYAMFTTYEEVGHGCAWVPEGLSEAISVDMGCVGGDTSCTERQVSICAKDSAGPYDYDVTNKLIDAAKKEDADYQIDVYPFYTSDVDGTLKAGYDVKHGLIGAGVYASHGYERSHIDGVFATIKVIKGYLEV